MAIKLLTYHVLLKLDDPTEADETYRRAKSLGIELQLDKREQAACEYGTVIAIGPMAFKDLGGGPDLLSVGDRVSIARYTGKTVQDTNGDEYTLVNDADCLCVIQ